VVDAADQNNLEIARSELHNLLKKQDGKENPLAGIPLLVRLALTRIVTTQTTSPNACAFVHCRVPRQVLGNKKDLPGALTERELIDRMDLQSLAQARATHSTSPGVLSCHCAIFCRFRVPRHLACPAVSASAPPHTPPGGAGARGVHVLHFVQECGEH
jgi:hypothetical protein